jgi:hypothetical protein
VARFRRQILYLSYQSPLSSDGGITVEVFRYCRCPEGEGEAPYRNIQRSAVASIKRLCKVVNQTMLLQNLHDTRMCDQLLEQEASEDIWKAGPGVS